MRIVVQQHHHRSPIARATRLCLGHLPVVRVSGIPQIHAFAAQVASEIAGRAAIEQGIGTWMWKSRVLGGGRESSVRASMLWASGSHLFRCDASASQRLPSAKAPSYLTLFIVPPPPVPISRCRRLLQLFAEVDIEGSSGGIAISALRPNFPAVKAPTCSSRAHAASIADKSKFDSKPGQHGRTSGARTSDYGLQLREKQKVKRMYGILKAVPPLFRSC